jgi:hypothetical protein
VPIQSLGAACYLPEEKIHLHVLTTNARRNVLQWVEEFAEKQFYNYFNCIIRFGKDVTKTSCAMVTIYGLKLC